MRQTSALLASLLTLGIPCASALADVAEVHPNYVQAISDLKSAKIYLGTPDTPNLLSKEIRALGEVEACLKDIRAISIAEGKDIKDAPPTDAGDRSSRMVKALELLRKARLTIYAKEDDVAALKSRASALKHIELAIDFVEGRLPRCTLW